MERCGETDTRAALEWDGKKESKREINIKVRETQKESGETEGGRMQKVRSTRDTAQNNR